MNSYIKRALGIIFAEQKGDVINLFGIKTGLLRRDIMRTWSTSRIEGNIFQKMTSSMISFNAFFAPDVHYMLQELLHKGSKDYVSTSKRHIRAAIAALQENTWLSRLNDPEFKSKLDRSKLALFHKAPSHIKTSSLRFTIVIPNDMAYMAISYRHAQVLVKP